MKTLRPMAWIPAIALTLICCALPGHAATHTWTGSGNWSHPGNWSGGLVPGPADDVVFDGASTNAGVIDAAFGGTVRSVAVAADYTGAITQNRDLSVDGDFTLSNGVWRFTSGTPAMLAVGGNLTVAAVIECQRSSTDGHGAGRVISVGGDLTIATNGVVDAQGHGFDPGLLSGAYNPLAGPGQGVSSDRSDPRCGSGGGHGGEGGRMRAHNTAKPGGGAYGSLTHPFSLGSGGGGGHYNPQLSFGGGAIALLVTGNVRCDGVINANAAVEQNTNGGGGAGGGIFIQCGAFDGEGTLSANGADATGTLYGGGGGGGRIAIHCVGSTFSGIMTAVGGNGVDWGAAGTIYWKPADPDPGTLLIDNAGRVTAAATQISSNVTDTWVGHVSIRDAGHLRLLTNQTLTVQGSWTNSGLFSSHSGGTLVLASDREAVIAGNNPFENLTCTNEGKRIVFAAGSTSTVANILVLTGADGDPIRLDSTTAAPWHLVIDDQPHDIRHVDVRWSDARGGDPVMALDSVDSGDNHNWIFGALDQTNTWLGTLNTDWGNGANWDLGRPSIYSDTVIIAGAGAHAAVLDFDKRMRELRILPGAVMSLGGRDLTVAGDIRVQGTLGAVASETLTAHGDLDLAGGTLAAAESIAVIGGGAVQAITSGACRFHRIRITNTSARVTFRDAVTADRIETVNADVRFQNTVHAGVFSNYLGAIRFGGDLMAGDFDCRQGPVAFVFRAGAVYTITNLYLFGSDGHPLTLRSSIPGIPWRLNAVRCRYVAYVDVRDSNAGGGTAIMALNSTDGGNNTHWTFIEPGESLTWSGAVSGEFGHPDNWRPARVPGATNIILLDGHQVHAPVIATPWSVSNLFAGGPLPVTLTIDAPLMVNGDLTVLENATLTHSGHVDTPLYRMDVTVSGDLLLDGVIDVDGKGYAPTRGPGAGVSSLNNAPRRGSGGGHGGEGGQCTDSGDPGYQLGGTTYGSVTNPVTLGSGGGWGHYDPQVGFGGGAIALRVAGRLVCNGTITACGATNWIHSRPDSQIYGGAGAGGSILLICRDLQGAGWIRADGGRANPSRAGAGGGGRIALYYTDNTFSGGITAVGGNASGRGAAGTLYIKPADRTHGSLLIDNRDRITVSRTLVSTNVSDSLVGDVTLLNRGHLAIGTNQTLTVYGDWNNSAAFSSEIDGTVFFTGTEPGEIRGSNTFHHLAIGDPDVKPVRFDAGSRQTVTGHLTAHHAILESTIAGSPWQLRLVEPLPDADHWPRRPRVTAVELRDSDASSGATIYAYWDRDQPSIDLGNNQNWIFRQPRGGILAIR